MNTRVRTALQTMKTPPKHNHVHDRVKEKEKEKTEKLQRNRAMDAGKAMGTSRSRRERKIALQQDVDKLKKKLQHEENVHRALERAFTRPLGALPRLPPYLPPYTLELLAEVAVLEEEVVRLEEQVVNFRQGLYQEAIYISSSKKTIENASDLYPCPNVKKTEQSKTPTQCVSSETPASDNNNELSPVKLQSSPVKLQSNPERNGPSSNRIANGKRSLKKPSTGAPVPEDRRGKENHLDSNSAKISKQSSPQKKVTRTRPSGSVEKNSDNQVECKATNKERAEERSQSATDVTVTDVGGSPNRISEDILKCLLSIFSRMSSPENTETETEMVPSISGSQGSLEEMEFRDPYDICPEFGERDIGPYKHFRSIVQNSIDLNLVTSSSFLMRKLKLLLRKLEMVDLRGLNHQRKLAFWINIYNSCMMNAFLEHGIPATPQMVVALMQKAMINVGGHLLSAMTIEHFILRLPYHSKYAFSKGSKNDEMATRSILGLDWPEPLVTFALSCGSWSSPAVRVYTASQVENELEKAKRDYLQAAVGISLSNKFAIPKLLDWYLLDFAKDVESLMDWICLQLPSGLRNEAVKCIERARRGVVALQTVQVLPYEFSFRYLLAAT